MDIEQIWCYRKSLQKILLRQRRYLRELITAENAMKSGNRKPQPPWCTNAVMANPGSFPLFLKHVHPFTHLYSFWIHAYPFWIQMYLFRIHLYPSLLLLLQIKVLLSLPSKVSAVFLFLVILLELAVPAMLFAGLPCIPGAVQTNFTDAGIFVVCSCIGF